MARLFGTLLAHTLVALCLGSMLSACVREKPAPPSAAPASTPRDGIAARDLVGKSRKPRQGITPGALEAEEPPPPPAKRSPERRRNS